MKKKLNNIDNFFTSNLEGFQAEVSPALWDEIENGFLDSYLGRDNFFKRVWPLVAIFTAGMISLAIVLNRDVDSSIYSSPVSNNVNDKDFNNNNESKTYKDVTTTPEKEIVVKHDEPIEEPVIQTSENTIINQEVDNSEMVSEDIIIPIISTHPEEDYASTETTEINDEVEEVLPYLMPIGDFLYFETFSFAAERIDYIETVKLQPITNVNDYYRKSELLIGAHITPAVTYYPGGENKNSYAFEITADYEKSDFFVQSGVGAEYYNEKGNYSITFESFDSVGYYYDVTSFEIDPQDPDSIIFNLKSTGIYDSLEHITIKETSNKYFYMQVPLNVGYRIWENDRFSIKVRGGLVFSWLVYKDEPAATYEANDVSLIDIQNNYPGRRKFNWQWMAGIGLNVRLSRKLVFSVEPVYKQYINSIYTKGSGMDNKLPYSVGLRTGIYLNF